MKILYGVCAEGMGHATRSDVIAQHLRDRGHEVQIACSGPSRALDYLRARWGEHVVVIPGFRLVVKNNRVMPTETLLRNASVLTSPAVHALGVLQLRMPDVVITDFDGWTARYAHLVRKPLVAVDNIHFLTRCQHPREWIDTYRDEAATAMLVTESCVPDAKFYFVLAFTKNAPVKQPLTALQLPVVRESIAQAKVTEGEHLVAYFNDTADWQAILGALAKSEAPARVYGYPSCNAHVSLGSVTICPFSEEGLVHDLASCRAAVGGAGFSFLSEALALKKPLLAVPFAGSWEQILNAHHLEREGFGMRATELTSDAVGRFLERLVPMKDRIAGFPAPDGNRSLLGNLDRLLETFV